MESVAKTSFVITFFIFSFVGLALLASHSIYRQDVRNCMHDSEQTETSCETKFK